MSKSHLEQTSSWIIAFPSLSAAPPIFISPCYHLPLPIVHWDFDSCHFCCFFLHLDLDFWLTCLILWGTSRYIWSEEQWYLMGWMLVYLGLGFCGFLNWSCFVGFFFFFAFFEVFLGTVFCWCFVASIGVWFFSRLSYKTEYFTWDLK